MPIKGKTWYIGTIKNADSSINTHKLTLESESPATLTQVLPTGSVANVLDQRPDPFINIARRNVTISGLYFYKTAGAAINIDPSVSSTALSSNPPSDLNNPWNDARAVTIRDCSILYAGGHAIFVDIATQTRAEYIFILNNYIKWAAAFSAADKQGNLRFDQPHFWAGCSIKQEPFDIPGGWGSSISIQADTGWQARGSQVLIKGNRILQSWGESIIVKGIVGAAVVENRIENSYSVSIYLDGAQARVRGNFIESWAEHGGGYGSLSGDEPTIDHYRLLTGDCSPASGVSISNEFWGNHQPDLSYRSDITSNIIRGARWGIEAYMYSSATTKYGLVNTRIIGNTIVLEPKDSPFTITGAVKFDPASSVFQHAGTNVVGGNLFYGR